MAAVAAVAVMSRPKGKIPRIRFDEFQPITLRDESWQTIEAAYCQSFSQKARTEISAVTNQFLQFALAESSTGTIDDAVRRTKRISKSAQSLIAAIEERVVGDVTRDYVDEELGLSYAQLNGDEGNEAHKYVSGIVSALFRFVNVCSLTVQKLSEVSANNYWPDGWAWEAWIWQLTSILNAHDLPTAVRKDTDKQKSDRPSPFVVFVSTLQTFLPQEHIRGQHSKGALAVAIYKARQGSKAPVAPRKLALSERVVIRGNTWV